MRLFYNYLLRILGNFINEKKLRKSDYVKILKIIFKNKNHIM